MSKQVKRRFIAGATCPACKASDTLFLAASDLNGAFECTTCGYKEEPPASIEQKQHNIAVEPESVREEAVKFVDVMADGNSI